MRSCCILNGGGGAWAFGGLAAQLGRSLWLDVSEVPREFNYLLLADGLDPAACGELFIPYRAVQLAADKRLLAAAFAAAGVPTPETRLVGSLAEAERVPAEDPGREWCLKFPTGCGASGHRRLVPGMVLPKSWPLPLVVQEFVRLDRPEVYRTYVAGGQSFGWVVRRFPDGVAPSPWVAHARGARYEAVGAAPGPAVAAARAALAAAGLLESFGCADLLRRRTGEWVVLEVGTDGLFNHVDRELGLPGLEHEVQWRVAEAFWARLGGWRPWGPVRGTPDRWLGPSPTRHRVRARSLFPLLTDRACALLSAAGPVSGFGRIHRGHRGGRRHLPDVQSNAARREEVAGREAPLRRKAPGLEARLSGPSGHGRRGDAADGVHGPSGAGSRRRRF
ncbi:ATP-grasp domain-containing protein [Frigoriglobus tundricola]|uniref:hypothetical protein n=1 Tax=Frigoriglobus tundricola TaxID=2774151 RepID=UPI0018725BF6|nr:hypothetical protein [Frigoriglobus tundricola]